ncbi:peptidoglycan-binding protein [Streptomyces sp. NPDC048442]|uniref:peptidoglycan-binding domain-containing protein n=1 Tax=Streptomyces sp. NPDC048442 TaxID=3154823 RepID=UPI00342FE16B
MPLRAVPAPYSDGPVPHAGGPVPHAGEPAPYTDEPARYTTETTSYAGEPAPYSDEPPRRRRGRGIVLLAATAAAAILTGAAFAVGAFDSDTGGTRALPAGGTPTAAPTLVTESSAESTPSRTASAPASPTATASRSARPTPTRTTRSAPPTHKATPPPSKTPTAPASSPVAPPPPAPPASTLPPGSLAQGSTGPDVRELQDRLSQVWLYHGALDGRYTSRVTSAVASYQSRMDIDDDPQGVYGPATRASLEDFTEEP